jgi:hypothetical protein
MGYGNCVLTLAAPENIEAIGNAGIPYSDESDLAEKLQRVLRDGSLVQSFRHRAQARVREHYDWEYVVDQYEKLFAAMAVKSAGKSADYADSADYIKPEELAVNAPATSTDHAKR